MHYRCATTALLLIRNAVHLNMGREHRKKRFTVTCEVCKADREVGPDRYQVMLKAGSFACHKCKSAAVQADPKFKAKLSAASKVMWENPAYREAVIKNSQAVRSRPDRVAARKAKMLEPGKAEERKANSARSNRLGAAKISASAKQSWKDGVYANSYTEERRKKASERNIKAWEDEGYRLKMEAKFNEPEYRAEISKRVKAQWTDEYREKMRPYYESEKFLAKNRDVNITQSHRVSKPQLALYDILNTLQVDFIKEGSGTVLGPYVFDCLVPKQGNMSKSLLIEVHGDYWHGLKNNERRDRSKFTYVERYYPDHELMYVWEHEMAAKDSVIGRVSAKVGLSIPSVEFDLIDIKLCDAVPLEHAKVFLNAYHYIGRGRGGKTIGAYHGDKLVGLCCFSPPNRNNHGVHGDFVELSRLCIHPSYHQKNFASWLIGKSVKRVDKTVVAYADTTVGHDGTVYKASNFKLSHEVPADYWYCDKSGWVMHKQTLYARARSLKMVESEFADKFEYFKKWGGKKLCFVLKR